MNEQTVYILHSRECLTSGIDLRDCRFSLALDRQIGDRLDRESSCCCTPEGAV
jgi:hypothetical protein